MNMAPTLKVILAELRRQMAEEFEWRERNKVAQPSLFVTFGHGESMRGQLEDARRSLRLRKTGHKGG